MTEPASTEQAARAVDGAPRGEFSGVLRRIYLTVKYRGVASLLYRIITFPLRFTPLRRRLALDDQRILPDTRAAEAWYRDHGRAVAIVIPSYQDLRQVRRLVASIRRTTDPARVRIIVSDDASGAEHLSGLNELRGVDVVETSQNAGFAANANRGFAAAGPGVDIVLLNSDVIVSKGWLASLQYAATQAEDIGIVGGKLLYPNDRIQFAGTIRNTELPEWFDHRFRFRPASWGPANVAAPMLAVTGACMYIRHEVLERVGHFDEGYGMAFEDVDLCLRAWQAGFRVMYWPAAELYHDESVTRGTTVGARERSSQQRFWTQWGAFFDGRNVRTEAGAEAGVLRVIYVTEDTGVGGGHRDVFEHLNGLLDRGHDAQLWSLAGPPDWFPLRAPVRTFSDYDELAASLAPIEAIKVATWWNTAEAVWRASVLRGIPVYFVQDIETSYYPDSELTRYAVLASYRPEFRYMTISSWNQERLRELGMEAALIPPGIDLDTFRPLPEVRRRDDMILALGRSNPLKNLSLTIKAWRSLPEPRPELCLFGIEPELAAGERGIRYVEAPSDEEVNRLFNQATAFVQTSTHEGFCLPPLEAMAAGGAVVCTDAHGNRDFCVDGENCVVPDATVKSVSRAVQRLLGAPDLRERFGKAGVAVAADYAWPKRIDELERFLDGVADAQTARSAISL